MLNRIRTFFLERAAQPQAGCDKHDETELKLAAAALLAEMAEMDHALSDDEEARIIDLVVWRFDLEQEEARDLVARAREQAQQSVQNFGFTQTINDGFDYDERVQLVEMLWDIAYTDGRFHHMESNMMRRIAGLLHVSDYDSGLARQRVVARTSTTGENP